MPLMPPFSAGAGGVLAGSAALNGLTANSMKLFWPSSPCQPCVEPQGCGGKIVPDEAPPPASPRGQSALSQYLAPGKRRSVGSGTRTAVLARFAAMVEQGNPSAVA